MTASVAQRAEAGSRARPDKWIMKKRRDVFGRSSQISRADWAEGATWPGEGITLAENRGRNNTARNYSACPPDGVVGRDRVPSLVKEGWLRPSRKMMRSHLSGRRRGGSFRRFVF